MKDLYEAYSLQSRLLAGIGAGRATTNPVENANHHLKAVVGNHIHSGLHVIVRILKDHFLGIFHLSHNDLDLAQQLHCAVILDNGDFIASDEAIMVSLEEWTDLTGLGRQMLLQRIGVYDRYGMATPGPPLPRVAPVCQICS